MGIPVFGICDDVRLKSACSAMKVFLRDYRSKLES